MYPFIYIRWPWKDIKQNTTRNILCHITNIPSPNNPNKLPTEPYCGVVIINSKENIFKHNNRNINFDLISKMSHGIVVSLLMGFS